MRHIFLTLSLVWALVIAIFFIACEIPYQDYSSLSLTTSSGDDDRDDDDDDDDDDDFTKICDDRDSCQDICDTIFKSSSARSECYKLDIDDVNGHQEVFDELSERQVDRRDLNSIDEDLFREYIELSPNSWDDIIRGDGKSRTTAYTKAEAFTALTWIIENEDIAEAILKEDDDLNILYSLLVRYAKGHNLTSIHPFQTDSTTTIKWEADKLTISQGSSNSQSVSIDAIDETLDFIVAFIGIYRSDATKSSSYGNSSNQSFVHFADKEAEDPYSVFELSHKTLEKFCIEATNEDERDDEDVLKCMMAMYCSIQTTTNDVKDNWNTLEDSPFNLDGDTSEMCTYDFLTDNDNLERLF